MAMRSSWLLLALVGCDRVFGIYSVAPPVDTSTDADSWTCAAPSFATWVAARFAITDLMGNAMNGITHPTLDVDRHTILFSAHSDIWAADRNGTTSANNANRVDTLSVINNTETTPTLWPDDATLYVEENGTTILASGYSIANNAWKTGVAFTPPVVGIQIGAPAETMIPGDSMHGVRMVVASATPPFDLHEYAIASQTEWLEVASLAMVNTAADERDPYLSADGCFLLFSSNRVSSADHDLYVSRRGADGNFLAPTMLPFSGTGADDVTPTSSRFSDEIIWVRGDAVMRAHPP